MDKLNKNPEIRFKGFTADWELSRLGEICLIGDIDHRMPPTVASGIPYLMTGDFIGINKLNFENTKLISFADYNQLSKKIKPEVGDILFARYASVGAIRYVETKRKFLVSYSCAIIKKSDLIYGKYLYYYLQTKQIQHQIEVEINTGSQRNIGIDSLNKINLKLPNKVEQKQIGSFFQSLDNLITLNQKKYDKLIILKKAMLAKMFPRNGAVAPEIRFKGFTEDWKQKKLSEFSNYHSSSLSVSDAKTTGKYKLYDASKVIGFTNMNVQSSKYITIIKDGSGVGRVRLMPENTSYIATMGAISSTVADVYFLFCCLIRTDFTKHITGATIPHIYFSKYGEEYYFIPGLEEQQKIGLYFNVLDRQISLRKTQIVKLKNIKKACFSKMFVAQD